jgi:hypothetical protein
VRRAAAVSERDRPGVIEKRYSHDASMPAARTGLVNDGCQARIAPLIVRPAVLRGPDPAARFGHRHRSRHGDVQ